MSIRDSLNPNIGGIGKKVERQPEKQTPAIFKPIPSNPDIVRGPDGKLETLIPQNELANGYVYGTPWGAIDFTITMTGADLWAVTSRDAT